MFVHLIRLVNLSNLHQKFQFVDVLLCPAARPVFVMQVKGWFTYYATDSGRTILENLLRLFTIRTRKTKVWKKHEIKRCQEMRDVKRCETCFEGQDVSKVMVQLKIICLSQPQTSWNCRWNLVKYHERVQRVQCALFPSNFERSSCGTVGLPSVHWLAGRLDLSTTKR